MAIGKPASIYDTLYREFKNMQDGLMIVWT